jgi:hypothetical protein
VVENPFKKNSKKLLTPPLPSGIVALHTVTTRTTTTHKMRTKTLLLTAAALLAAGIVSSQAQPVYSQNIVGYASAAYQNGINTCSSIPFAIGASNGLNEVFPSLPLSSKMLIWNPVTSGFDNYIFDDLGSGPGWCDGSDSFYLTSIPTLPAGKGFFLVAGDNVTNTFAGTIAVQVGATNNMNLVNGINALVSCVVPYAGSITNGTSLTGGPNLNNLPLSSKLLIWNPVTSGYDNYIFDDLGSGPGWCDGTDSFYVTPPSIVVGQGFFIVPGGNWTWTVGL